MIVTCISDTHGLHRQLNLTPGEVLIHAGDFSNSGSLPEIADFLHWFARQPFRHKIFIAGNHDFLAEHQPTVFRSMIPAGCHYLENSGVVIEGRQFWGSPITPWFLDWAFNRHRGEDIRQYWQQIPAETDILITHGPPAQILDQNHQGMATGCADLRVAVEKIAPQVHVCGHIHEARGEQYWQGTHFVNASSVNDTYTGVFQAIEVELGS